jgi:hypothetical protein
MDFEPRQEPPSERAEWTYLIVDIGGTCSVCGQDLHAGQAVGRVDGKNVHARCKKDSSAS